MAKNCKKLIGICSCLVTLNFGSIAADPAEMSTKDINKWYAVADGGLRMREIASTKGKIITLIPFGAVLEATGNEVQGNETPNDLWTEVRYKGNTGWVSNSFLNTTPLPEKPAKNFDWRGQIFYNAPSYLQSRMESAAKRFGISVYADKKKVTYIFLDSDRRRIGRRMETQIRDFRRLEYAAELSMGLFSCTDSKGAEVPIALLEFGKQIKESGGKVYYSIKRGWVVDEVNGLLIDAQVKGITCSSEIHHNGPN